MERSPPFRGSCAHAMIVSPPFPMIVYILADGSLWETSRDGYYNEREDRWSADIRPVEVAHAILTYKLTDIVQGLRDALYEQINGNKGKATQAAREMAAKLEAVAKLIAQ